MPAPERGDIYHIDIPKSEVIGHEFYGPHWWVVLSIGPLNKALKLFTAVPLTSIHNKVGGEPKDHDDFRYFRIRIIRQSKKADPSQQHSEVFQGDSIALPESIRHFSIDRITAPRLGTLDSNGLAAIEDGLLFVNGAGIQRQHLNLQTTGVAPKARVAVPEEAAKPVPSKPATKQP